MVVVLNLITVPFKRSAPRLKAIIVRLKQHCAVESNLRSVESNLRSVESNLRSVESTNRAVDAILRGLKGKTCTVEGDHWAGRGI